MLGTALYYPHIDIRDGNWLKSAILFWDEIQTIAPTSIRDPYQEEDSKICEQEGYLRPLRCDLHQDVLEELGKRVLKFMDEPEWFNSMLDRRFGGPDQRALMHGNKLGDKLKWRMKEIVGMHPDKMPSGLRALFVQSGGLEFLSAGKLPRHFRQLMEDFDLYGMDTRELSRMLRHLPTDRLSHEDSDWVLVNGEFGNIYMSALAALLAREIDVSPLTNEESSSGINLRCLIDDVASAGAGAARGALVAVVMEGLHVDPSTPIQNLLNFRKAHRDQLAELSGKFEILKSAIEKSENGTEIESQAKRVFENEVRPALTRLKSELKHQAIESAWEGFQTASTFSAAPSAALWATGFSAPVALGVGAFITAAGIGIKSQLSL